MAGNSFRDTLAKPVINVTSNQMFTGAAHILPLYNKQSSRMIEGGLAERKGNILKFKIERQGGEAGEGANLKINPVTAHEHREITTYGNLNYGIAHSLYESTYEATAEEIKKKGAVDAGKAFSRKVVDRYLAEVVQAENFVVFNPGNPGNSLLALKAKIRRMKGVNRSEKMNFAGTTGMWQAIENVKHANTSNQLIQQMMMDYNQVDDINAIPTYVTGDRTGLCLKVYTSCQRGCTLYITGGPNAAGRKIINKGEVLEIEGVYAIDEESFLNRGELRQFRVACDVYADSNGRAAVQVEPEILPLDLPFETVNQLGQKTSSLGRKNVKLAPMDGADVYVSRGLDPSTEYEQTIIWHNDMMVKVKANLDINLGKDKSASMNLNSKIAGDLGRIYYSMDGDIHTAENVHRWDMSIDYINLFPQYGYKLVGNRLGSA